MNDQLYDHKTNPDGVSGAYLDAQRRKAPDHRTYEQRILASSEATLRALERNQDLLLEAVRELKDINIELRSQNPLMPIAPTPAKPKARR